MSKSQLRAVLNALPELRAQGVERVKVGADGSVEIELSEMQPQRAPQLLPQGKLTPNPSAQRDWEHELRDAMAADGFGDRIRDAMSPGLPESQNSANLSTPDSQQADGTESDAEPDTRSPAQRRDDKLDFGEG